MANDVFMWIIGGVVLIGGALVLLLKGKKTEAVSSSTTPAASSSSSTTSAGGSSGVSATPSSGAAGVVSGGAGEISSVAATAQAGLAAQATAANKINLGGNSLNNDAYYVNGGIIDHNGTYYTGYGQGTLPLSAMPKGTTIGGKLVAGGVVTQTVVAPTGQINTGAYSGYTYEQLVSMYGAAAAADIKASGYVIAPTPSAAVSNPPQTTVATGDASTTMLWTNSTYTSISNRNVYGTDGRQISAAEARQRGMI